MHFNNPTYLRCIAAKQYQNAANIRGCSVATIIAEQEAVQKNRQAVAEASAAIKVYPSRYEAAKHSLRDPWLIDATKRLMRAGVQSTEMSSEMGLNRGAVSGKLNGSYLPQKAWRDNFEAAFARILARRGVSASDYPPTVDPDTKVPVPEDVTVPSYVKEACAKAGIDPSLVLTNCRRRELAHARQHVMWLLHQRGWSYPKIGQALGGMNHATIIHGVAAHEKRMAQAEGRAA